jgi:cytochrome c-type biogenesis protein CcmF
MQMIQPLSLGLTVFVSLSFGLLITSFLQDDFSVKYVAQHSHTDLPILFKLSATWGAHEGSLLLWAWILTLWIGLASRFSTALSSPFSAQLFSVLGLIAIGFLTFILLTSNPFERLLDAPAQGRSLNPLLQDFGLALHPPLLYMGYVGFVIPFAFAVASLQMGVFQPQGARWLKPWVLSAWGFLTLGIALGSWWAYYELGWGGWWFWDPVENASLLPWLAGTALLHSLIVTEKRNQFQSWTLLLALLAFSLSLLGTFLVRSGVLTSVHAFTTDPSRGVFILVFLGLVIGLSLSLYAKQAPQFRSEIRFHWLSREFALLLNNLLLLVMLATVLLGTLYPLLLDALGFGKISVGAPYFNQVMFPLTMMLAGIMGLGLILHWHRDNIQRLIKQSVPLLLLSISISLFFAWILQETSWTMILGLSMSLWVLFGSLLWLFLSLTAHQTRLKWRAYASIVAHIGFGVSLLGMLLVSLLGVEKDIRLAVGNSYQLQDYRFELIALTQTKQANYQTTQADIWVYHAEQKIAELHPEKRYYDQQSMPMTEAGIDVGLTRDLFVALGEPLGTDAWSMRIQIKPFIRWIWLGAILMAIGALLAILPRTTRR